MCVPRCQRCQALNHECYGLSDKVCGRCQRDKKTCQDVIVEGKLPIACVWEWETKPLVVDPVPATQHRIVPMVVPPVPVTMLVKKVTVKGKAPVRRTTCPCPRKVTRVQSPSPVVVEAPRPDLGVSGPSAVPWPPLFEESILSGSGEVGAEVPVSLGEQPQAMPLRSD